MPKCTLRYAHTRVRCSECNCTKIMHALYFRIFWQSRIQIGCIMHILYECHVFLCFRSSLFDKNIEAEIPGQSRHSRALAKCPMLFGHPWSANMCSSGIHGQPTCYKIRFSTSLFWVGKTHLYMFRMTFSHMGKYVFRVLFWKLFYAYIYLEIQAPPHPRL